MAQVIVLHCDKALTLGRITDGTPLQIPAVHLADPFRKIIVQNIILVIIIIDIKIHHSLHSRLPLNDWK